ncbi:MAG: choline oxidase [Solirubrobacterales bacterium]|jgi:choline oxidase|nr:choline oxidase [Solirubrobacterales bacterium]
MRSADYVIAGGGTAGAVVAKRLAEAGAEVILVEAGPTGERDDRVNVLSRWMELLGSELDYDYRTRSARGNDLMRYPQARVLGGCSAHNGAAAFRTPDWDLDAWAELGAAGWGAEDSSPYFDRLFSQVPLAMADGDHEWVNAFIEAAHEAGLPLVDMGQPNVGEGAGWFMQNRTGELRASSAAAYLFPLSDCPANLQILTDETVLRVLFDQRGDALGIETARGPIIAREEVVLCGGTFGSSKLLLLSGIGPGDHLRAVGIEQIAESPGVGQHLIDHPEGLILWEAEGPPQGSARSHWESGAFLPMPGGSEFPEIQVQVTTMRYEEMALARGYPRGEHIFAALPNVARARSEGSVRLRSADPSAPLEIDTGYFTDPEGYDEKVMLEGMRWTRALADRPALSRVIKRELVPGPAVSDDAGLIECARTVGDSVIHPAGTCKMGADEDPMAVLDPQLRVRGVGRLRVADASIFPSMPTVNPCLTVMMIGERCAAEIVAGSG